MSKKVYVYTLCSLAVVLTAGLLIVLYGLNRPVIDGNYLESEKFKTLENQLEGGRKQKLKQKLVLDRIAKDILHDSTLGRLEFPVLIDTFSLNRIITKNSVDVEGNRLSSPLGEVDFFAIGSSDSRGVSVVLFLMKRPTVYRDIDVVLATAKNSDIKETKVVATFRNSITEEITSSVRINKNLEVHTEILSVLKYPVEQQNVVKRQYSIDRNGKIHPKGAISE